MDAQSGVKTALKAPLIEGVQCLNESFEIEGYSDIRAKLRVFRSKKQLPGDQPRRFRSNGILVMSGRGVHESTYFETALERDPYAHRFYGTLKCEGLDQLEREFDDRTENDETHPTINPMPVIDPNRRAGLTRDHPFFSALKDEVLYRLRPLVDKERQRAEAKKERVESKATRRRLNKLEEAAAKFMSESAQDEVSREPTRQAHSIGLKKKGYMLSPPYVQMLKGSSTDYKFSVNREAFPNLRARDTIQVVTTPGELALAAPGGFDLEPDPADNSVLACKWSVRAVNVVKTTAVTVNAGDIEVQSLVEVLESEADKYRDVSEFGFRRSRYQIKINSKKRNLRVLAPIDMIPDRKKLAVEIDHPNFTVFGETLMQPAPELGISYCDLHVESGDQEANGRLSVEVDGHSAEATLQSFAPLGSNLVIKLEDIDHNDQRYRYTGNVIEIAGQHPSLKRYLGRKEDGFPGQESMRFIVILAEIVSDAVCSRIMARNEEANEEEYEDMDWDSYYASFSRLMTEFLPIAHKTMIPRPQG